MADAAAADGSAKKPKGPVQERLAGISILAGLSPAEMALVEQSCTWRRYKRGEQILDRNSPSRDVFFVVEGSVAIVNYSVSGREVAYASVPAGGFFGELAALDGEPRSASVVADQHCLVAALPPQHFQDLLMRHGQTALHVLLRLARVIRTCDERIMDLATLGAVQRVHVELLRMARPDPVTPGSWLVYPVPTQQEIANRASTTRETVARVIGQLQASNLVSRKGKTLYIADRDALDRLTERLNPHKNQVPR